jgi:uncharacterized protein
MSREYPDWISPERAAEGKRVFAGTVPFSRMKRLLAMLAAEHGGTGNDTAVNEKEASFVAKFRRDLDKRVVIDLQVEAVLPLVCQASLEVYDELVKRRTELAVIKRDSEMEDLPENYEAVIVEQGKLEFTGLVEDELLLGVPYFPRKPGADKVKYSTVSQSDGKASKDAEADNGNNPPVAGMKRPFAALQDLMERKK